MNSTSFTPAFASGGSSGWSKESIIAIVGVFAAFVVPTCGFLLKRLLSRVSAEQSIATTSTSSQDQDLELGYPTSNTNHTDLNESRDPATCHLNVGTITPATRVYENGRNSRATSTINLPSRNGEAMSFSADESNGSRRGTSVRYGPRGFDQREIPSPTTRRIVPELSIPTSPTRQNINHQ
ncbi:hypothetical protein HDK64DRAFT_296240 [Phyllosticta capitalensis]